MKKHISIVSLGCDKNTVDAEKMAFLLQNAGYKVSFGAKPCDAIIVNTCGFIESAKSEAIAAILDAADAKARGDVKAVIATGCLVERYKDEIMGELPEIDSAVSLCRDRDIVAAVASALSGQKTALFGADKQTVPEGGRILSTPKHFAYLKIADGCSNHCTYCAIPSIRGGFVSRKSADVIDETKKLAASGVKELILVAQDTTAFGRDTGEDFCDLLDMICAVEGIELVRILYAYPDGLTDRLIETIKNQPKIAKYIDIPLQHADDSVLRHMGRKLMRAETAERLNTLRSAVPGIAVRTTFIAGFPGETAEQFESLMGFVREQGFARGGCFAFSAEEGTAAERMGDKVPEDEIQRRASDLSLAMMNSAFDFQETLVGKTERVICDGYDAEMGLFACRTQYDAPDIDSVVWVDGRLKQGEFYNVNITSAECSELYGSLCD